MTAKLDLTGLIFGKLKVLGEAPKKIAKSGRP
jgi:hypothetical protein